MKNRFLVLSLVMSALGFACSSAPVTSHSGETVGLTGDTKEYGPGASNRSPANWSTLDCLNDAVKDGCWFSNQDAANVLSYSNQCRTIESNSGETKVIVFRMAASGDLVAVRTKGTGVKLGGLSCPVSRVTTGEGGVKDIAARDNKVFFNTANGHIYYGTVDLKFYEILSNKGNQTDASGLDEATTYNRNGKRQTTVSMKMANGQSVEIDEAFLTKRRADNHVVEVKPDMVEKFQSTQGGRSPFTKH